MILNAWRGVTEAISVVASASEANGGCTMDSRSTTRLVMVLFNSQTLAHHQDIKEIMYFLWDLDK